MPAFISLKLILKRSDNSLESPASPTIYTSTVRPTCSRGSGVTGPSLSLFSQAANNAAKPTRKDNILIFFIRFPICYDRKDKKIRDANLHLLSY